MKKIALLFYLTTIILAVPSSEGLANFKKICQTEFTPEQVQDLMHRANSISITDDDLIYIGGIASKTSNITLVRTHLKTAKDNIAAVALKGKGDKIKIEEAYRVVTIGDLIPAMLDTSDHLFSTKELREAGKVIKSRPNPLQLADSNTTPPAAELDTLEIASIIWLSQIYDLSWLPKVLITELENSCGIKITRAGKADVAGKIIGAYRWISLIEKYAQQYGLEKETVIAMIAVESAGQADAKSDTGAVGLMQIMPPTGRDIVNYLADDGYMTTLKKIQTLPEENIRAGCRYIYWIKEVIDLADEGRKVFISYNGGLKRADLPDDKLPRETKEYVKQVIAYRAIIKLWEKIGIPLSAGNLAQK